ncbi:MAG TPA: hemerythrin domain-containing protein [Candidatus Thermoplasmatota archaeon]|nr:hemerythrin domain-containing protein [Candidatus Thermoplasmatota archaeon]
MDAVEMLKQDHRLVEDLFRQWEQAPAGQPEARREIAERIVRELMVHERVEEEIFYPAFKKGAGEFGREEVDHSKEEHLLVDSLLGQLEELDLEDPEFEATFLTLKENVMHHVEDEETKMFPVARQVMADKLGPLADDMRQYKASLTRQTEPRRQEDARRSRR